MLFGLVSQSFSNAQVEEIENEKITNKFADEIIKNSKVKLFLVNDQFQLARFIKQSIFGREIVIGMGAGTISNWMRQLPSLL